MMYKVIKYFVDLQDNNRPYNVGDEFPHKDASYDVSEDRFTELAGSRNKQGVPLIQLEEPKKKRAKKTAEE